MFSPFTFLWHRRHFRTLLYLILSFDQLTKVNWISVVLEALWHTFGVELYKFEPRHAERPEWPWGRRRRRPASRRRCAAKRQHIWKARVYKTGVLTIYSNFSNCIAKICDFNWCLIILDSNELNLIRFNKIQLNRSILSKLCWTLWFEQRLACVLSVSDRIGRRCASGPCRASRAHRLVSVF